MSLVNYDVIVVGAGLSGIVMAERFASILNKRVLVIDKRNHIGGNCYDFIDEDTGILLNQYGAHLFHTNDTEVFQYINKFCKWKRWEHNVVGLVDNQYVSIPANITTVNYLCNEQIKNSDEMDKWLSSNQVNYDKIDNSEQMAKSRVGNILYEKLFKHYTYKQWNCYPNDLLPEVLARIPVRNNYDTRYFSDKYQVLPEKGYTYFFNKIVEKNPLITVKLNTDYFKLNKEITDQIVIYTGPIDHYFSQSGFPSLEYRSILFETEKIFNTNYYQQNSVVNYPDPNTPYTRCVEYKHFLNQNSKHTIIVKEKTTSSGEPYYPVLNDKNIKLYEKYVELAKKEKNVHFIGRLASYKYFNMDQAIRNSMDYFKNNFLSNNINVFK
uniref:UDP-galactopyranose mutase n=1 Tax=Megaviridae environmental sample TaxID=1737588 RepID=A0A5J6VKV1_9VIRU|nr:MAG: UDP-galactopyranose mutase [Megaviridae environmental sample]